MTNIESPELSTKNCPKCQEKILKGAKKCKHCGADLRNWFVRHKILTAILIFFGIGILGSAFGGGNTATNTTTTSTGSSETLAAKEAVIKISAKDLAAQYEANGIQADEKYKDKILEVSGIIENLDKDFLDNSYVTLKSNEILSNVRCMLADSEESKAASLAKGTAITVQGRNAGKTIDVSIQNCIILTQ